MSPQTAQSPNTPSSADRFNRVLDIFTEVVGLAPARREAQIERLAGGDASIAAEVRAMLLHDAAVDSPALATGAGAAVADVARTEDHAPALLASLPRLSGNYRIVRVIGEGGMGVVYEAQQEMPRRSVALKTIKPEAMSVRSLERFVHEAHVLGRFQHPGIAQIYEVGVADDEPVARAYLVMELVDGPPITTYCRRAGLGPRARAALFARVCDAVHHAHQRGVIHRDIKPGNVLVSNAGEPKVLDFGVARAENATLVGSTLSGSLVGTLGYMAPEQLRSDPESVDAVSDVYALGAVLYELLAERPLLDLSGKPLAEAIALARESPRLRPPALPASLRGDPELIVQTALHPDRARRYASAAALADDLRRWIDGRPISARRDSSLYVLGKLARRHRAFVTLAAVLTLALVAFAVVSASLAVRNAGLTRDARTALSIADRERRRVADLNETLARELALAEIDRGRAEAGAGKLRLAEDSIWGQYFRHPDLPAAQWGLWELYHRIPCAWSAQGDRTTQTAAVCRLTGSTATLLASGAIVVYAEGGREQFRLDLRPARAISLAADPTQSRLAVGLASGRVALVGLFPGAALETLEGLTPHRGGVRRIAFSGDGQRVFAVGADNRISVWDACTLAPIDHWTPTPTLRAFAVDHAGAIVVTAPGAFGAPLTARSVNLRADLFTLPGEPGAVTDSLAFSPDDAELLWSRSDRSLVALNLRTGERSPQARSVVLRITSSLFAPDGRTVVLAGTEGLALFDRATGRVRFLGQQQSSPVAVGWAREGRFVSVNNDGTLRGFHSQPEPGLTRFTDYLTWVFTAAWSRDGSLLAFGAGEGVVAVHDGATLARIATIPVGVNLRTRGMHFLRDNRTLVFGSADGSVRIADALTGRVACRMTTVRSEIYGLAVDPAERFVATGHFDGSLRVWNLADGTLAAALPPRARRVDSIAFTPDGTRMLSTGGNSAVEVWDTATWTQVASLPTTAAPWGVCLSPDGSTLLVTTYDGAIDVFDGRTFEPRTSLPGHQRLIPAIAFNADGSLFATGSEDATIRLWDTASLRSVAAMDPGISEIVSVAFDPVTGRLAAAAASRQGIVYDFRESFASAAGNREFQRLRLAANEGDTDAGAGANGAMWPTPRASGGRSAR